MSIETNERTIWLVESREKTHSCSTNLTYLYDDESTTQSLTINENAFVAMSRYTLGDSEVDKFMVFEDLDTLNSSQKSEFSKGDPHQYYPIFNPCSLMASFSAIRIVT